MLAQVAVLTLALPALVSGALFPPGTKVKSIDAKGFRKAMSTNVGYASHGLQEKHGIKREDIFLQTK